ncbi:SAM-dependent methyltransferase [Ascidiimonas sp. W6]|uniref:SAM-dependent methyltransferase n=1 Tax=Ascidiimonas meishanensis TaxID=3128903 RepID=UPI0030EF6918
MKELNNIYWQERYTNNQTGWDIGYVSTPIKEYIDQLENTDLKILIPGAGNAHEASYFLSKGFHNVHILDFARLPLQLFKEANPDFPEVQLHQEDFFKHHQTYNLIIEQTFFCALSPNLREKYATHLAACLQPKGKVAGVLFDFELTPNGPPFGGSLREYQQLFSPLFHIHVLERCYNSIKPRAGNELFFIFEKKSL